MRAIAILSAFFYISSVIHTAAAQDCDTSVALCYAYNPPIDGLSKFDWAVVDSEAQFDPMNVSSDSDTVWMTYVSVGEVTSNRPYFNQIPKSWFMGENADWQSTIINQTIPEWPGFFINTIATPLWKRGFKGFFLDTLDSYQRVSNTDDQRAGLVKVIQSLKEAFPDSIIMTNRGFEIMAGISDVIDMVAFESLFSGWNQGQQKFVTVSDSDRSWLMARTREIQNNYELPVLAIDYYQPPNATWAENIVDQIQGQGVIPYVTDPLLQTVGYGPTC